MTLLAFGMTALMALVLGVVWLRWRQAKRADFIRSFTFPHGLFQKVEARHPQLALKDHQLVAHALRQFFLAHLQSNRQFVSMPSQVADDLWHEFILYTRNYALFCDRAFGRFMHHTPAVVLGRNRQNNTGLRRTWWHCCRQENIDPRNATRLPLLFALDAKLNIVGGFHYRADCEGFRRQGDKDGSTGVVHCGGDMSDSSYDGGTDGFGDSSSSDGGDGGGDGGGCGGGGD